MIELKARIKSDVNRRCVSIVNKYVAKRGGFEEVACDDYGNGRSVEFDKFVMVNVEGEWYRCRVTFSYDNAHGYDCYVYSIVNEKTKQAVN